MNSIAYNKQYINKYSAQNTAERLGKAKKSGDYWMCICPAHNDKNPSLGIKDNSDGTLQLRCFAKCSPEEITQTLYYKGLLEIANSSYQTPKKVRVATYQYHDEGGKLIFEKQRYINPKCFVNRRPDKNGCYIYDLAGICNKPLYKLPQVQSAIIEGKTIFVVDGEKDVDRCFEKGLIATCHFAGSSSKWEEKQYESLSGARVIIIPDNTKQEKEAFQKIATNLLSYCSEVKYLELSGLAEKQDISDWFDKGHTVDELLELVKNTPLLEISETIVRKQRRLKAIDFKDFMALELNDREAILSPWLLTQSISMVYAWRGVGKTHLALGIAYAVSTGQGFLKWNAEKPRKVLYVDGEMPAKSMQRRLNSILKAFSILPEDGYLKILTPDLQDCSMPNLANRDSHQELEPFTRDAELIIIDNLSCLASGYGKENDAESWIPMQDWALNLRRQGKAIVFIHHASKSGGQRGSSKKEDILDAVINLKHPSDYTSEDGARFEVIFEKNREIFGDEVKGFEAKLKINEDETQIWEIEDIEFSNYERVIELNKLQMSPKEIQHELGISLKHTYKLISQAKKEGKITN